MPFLEIAEVTRLVEQDIEAIWTDWLAGGFSTEALGRKYGVTGSQIRRILSGQSWRDVSVRLGRLS